MQERVSISSSDHPPPPNARFSFFDTVQQAWSKLGPAHPSSSHATSPNTPVDHPPAMVLDQAADQQGVPSSASNRFPDLTDDHIDTLFAHRDQDARRAVKAAVHEMRLNWGIDRGDSLDASKSDYNRGCEEIARLLSHLSLAPPGSQGGAAVDRHGNAQGVTPAPEAGTKAGASGSPSDARKAAQSAVQPPSARSWETHDLLRAIDRKDTETILRIRNERFDLLLDLGPGGGGNRTSARGLGADAMATPLGYCINLGPSHEGVAVVLVGALSKFINTLPDEQEYRASSNSQHVSGLDPRTQTRLRKLRISLKLAVDHSLAVDQTRLIASYIQVLLMSEGQSFLDSAVASVSYAIQPPPGILAQPPSRVAEEQVYRFVTDALRHRASSASSGSTHASSIVELAASSTRSAEEGPDEVENNKIAAVSDLLANAATDLLLMALWELVKLRRSERIKLEQDSSNGAQRAVALAASAHADVDDEELGERLATLVSPLPAYFFARDERMAACFVARITTLSRVLDALTDVGRGAASTRAADAKADAGGHDGDGGAPRIAPASSGAHAQRSPRTLRLAQRAAHRLSDEPSHRLSSTQRLEALRDVLDG